MITFAEVCEAYHGWTAPVRRAIRRHLRVGRHVARHIFYLPHAAVAAISGGLVCHQGMEWVDGPGLPAAPPQDAIIFTPLPELTGPIGQAGAVAVPEPAAIWLLAVGAVVILGIVRGRT